MEKELTVDELMDIAHRYSEQARRATDPVEKERFDKLANEYHLKAINEIHKTPIDQLDEIEKENYENYYKAAIATLTNDQLYEIGKQQIEEATNTLAEEIINMTDAVEEIERPKTM